MAGCTGLALLPGGAAAAADCAPISVTSATPENFFWNPLFNGYGNDNTSLTDWTAGDNSISVQLPSGIGANSGKTLWLFNDTLLGQTLAPAPPGQPYRHHAGGKGFARNTAVVQNPPDLWLTQTLYGGGPVSDPLPWIRHPEHPAKRYELLGARVEPASPGSVTKRLKIMLLEKDDSVPLYGGTLGYGVATLDPANLAAPLGTPVRFDAVDIGRGKIYWGVSLVPKSDGHTYIWGESSQTIGGIFGSNAYLARVAGGNLHNPWQWQFWNGSSWTAAGRQDLAQPVITFTGGAGGGATDTGVAHGFSVQQVGTRYALVTMDPTAESGYGVYRQLTMYTICNIADPEAALNPVRFGKNRFAVVPEAALPKPPGYAEYTGTSGAYMPALHPQFTHSTGLLLSYSLNDFAPDGAGLTNIANNVNRYRPKFMRVAVS
ncbi:hypothetical protein DPM19_33450 [Actinomadura craniellae]|uniref:DUF4185 domain-containing protein n=1 Tax=Actinomadura craniellae TaxID=2231787 RepID=A0A365GVT0_9ACTN|nr:hypothetical protein DPM19_33450 [Actinomadura craniellae]